MREENRESESEDRERQREGENLFQFKLKYSVEITRVAKETKCYFMELREKNDVIVIVHFRQQRTICSRSSNFVESNSGVDRLLELMISENPPRNFSSSAYTDEK